MGLRFQRRIRIMPGVNLNFSKSGLGLSVGPRGAKMSIGPNGSYMHLGIPGTGLAYREKLDKKGRTSNSSSSYSTSHEIQVSVSIDVAPQTAVETITLATEDGTPINDESMLRKIKRKPAVKEAILRAHQEAYDTALATHTTLFNLVQYCEPLLNRDLVTAQLSHLQPITLTPAPYPITPPTEAKVYQELEEEAKELIHPFLFWQKKKHIARYIEEKRSLRLAQHQERWNKEKEIWDTKQQQEITKVNEQNRLNYLKEKQSLEYLLDNDSSSGWKVFEEHISILRLPIEFDLSFEIKENTLFIDLDLPEIEDFPTTEPRLLSSGKLSRKKIAQKNLKEAYAKATIGLAYFFASLGFNAAFAIERVIVQGYTQRTSPQTGKVQDDYIFDIPFTRELFQELNIQKINPIESVQLFSPTMKLLKSYEFKTISPPKH